MFKNVEKQTKLQLKDLVSYQEGQEVILEEGETLVMPKDIPHAVYGEERFKMQLTVSF